MEQMYTIYVGRGEPWVEDGNNIKNGCNGVAPFPTGC